MPKHKIACKKTFIDKSRSYFLVTLKAPYYQITNLVSLPIQKTGLESLIATSKTFVSLASFQSYSIRRLCSFFVWVLRTTVFVIIYITLNWCVFNPEIFASLPSVALFCSNSVVKFYSISVVLLFVIIDDPTLVTLPFLTSVTHLRLLWLFSIWLRSRTVPSILPL